MSQSADTVRLLDIARSALKSLPDSLVVNKGLFTLATLRPESKASIGLLLQQQARRQPDHSALLFEDKRWSYDELNRWANRLAALFRAQGIKAGDSIAILMENRPEVLACVLGAVKIGAIAGMLNHNQRGEVLEHSLKLLKTKLVIVGDECVDALRSTASFNPETDRERGYLWDGPGAAPANTASLRDETVKQRDSDPPETARVEARSPCFYIFTSGTTGMPKASVMSHYRWLKAAAGLGQMSLRLYPDDIFYCCLPFYHNNALTVSFGAVLSSGATMALARKFSASRFWDDIRQFRATAFCYIGELCRYLLNRPATPQDRNHNIRVAVGNGLRPEIWDEFKTRFSIERICEFYGASEGTAAFVNGFGLDRTAGFCPLPYRIVEFDAVEEQPLRDGKGYMKKVKKGGVGLLITEVTKSNPFDGYTDKKASEAKLFRNVFKQGDCWFNSGDLVRDQGLRHIQFVDRVGDTFRWKGENVATTEVEAALNRLAGVEQAVAYGVQIPGMDGRAGMASLTWTVQPFNGQLLAQHLVRELPAYAVPLFIRLREEQEVTGTFKFRKVELKQQAFDPKQVTEPLYVLLDRERGYERLTPDIFQRIQGKEIRF